MASSSFHRKDSDRLFSTDETPHFFKIILPHTLREQKLEIPRKFVRNHGSAFLDNTVCLKIPSGEEWDVGLEKSNNNNNNNGQILIWFQNGWKEFVDFYSIQLGYFLVFRYEGDSCFNVIIFDHSASEIQYPIKSVYHNHGNKKDNFNGKRSENVEEFEDDCSIQILDNKIGSKRSRNEHSKPERFNFKELKKEQILGNEDLPCSKRESKGYKIGDGSKSQKTIKSRVTEKAKTFKSMTVNPSFMVTMWPSYIHRGSPLKIPKSFVEMHLKNFKDINIQVSNGRRVWNLRYCVRLIGKKRVGEFTCGWKRFVQDNNLKQGDVCVFEMVETVKILLKVTIFRVFENEMN